MEPQPTRPTPSRARWLAILLVVALAAVGGYLLVRRSSASSAALVPAAKPAADVLVAGSPVLLSAKATIVADRYNCLCGECSDTLGKCTCARDQGSNEMKATLNQLAAEKKSVSEIDAAMIAKYGSKVLVSGASPAPAAPAGK
jgi:hypothetical protein